MTSPLSEAARGRWRAILPALGVDPRFLTNKHGPCPMCGGKDRWRFDDKEQRGSWICSHCGAGDGPALVMRVRGCDFREAARLIEPLVGGAPRAPSRADRSDEEKRDACRRMWASSKPVELGDPVSRWLSARVGLTRVPACLRYHPRVRYLGEASEASGWHPAMIALVLAADGSAARLHRTWLTPDGRKAPVAKPRKLMEGGFAKGGAVRLMPYQDVLGIAEGIETAFAAAHLFAVPCWSAIASAFLAAWVPPDDVREVIVFGDNDPQFAGQAAAFSLARRLAGDRKVRVEIPATISGLEKTDWNDVLDQLGREHLQAAE
jgi:putative DNA primase/helicase